MACAFGHRRRRPCATVLKAAGVAKDAGIVDATDAKGFVKVARARQWAREPKVRTLA